MLTWNGNWAETRRQTHKRNGLAPSLWPPKAYKSRTFPDARLLHSAGPLETWEPAFKTSFWLLRVQVGKWGLWEDGEITVGTSWWPAILCSKAGPSVSRQQHLESLWDIWKKHWGRWVASVCMGRISETPVLILYKMGGLGGFSSSCPALPSAWGWCA